MRPLYTFYDVVIIGAGPSGLASGISAARSGARVLLIEQHPGVSIFPKATGIRGPNYGDHAELGPGGESPEGVWRRPWPFRRLCHSRFSRSP